MKRLLSFLLPHYFTKENIHRITNKNLVEIIQDLKKCNSTEEAMKIALKILADKYESKRFETYKQFYRIYEKDPNTLWNRKGFLHCTHQNYLFRILMIESGWLEDSQIELGYSLVWYVSPHQYLKIRLANGKKIAIDVWNYNFGAQYGQYASGFGMRRL